MTPLKIIITPGALIPEMPLGDGLPAPAFTAPVTDAPDARIFALGQNETVQAHLAVWWQDVPPYAGHRLGVIGGFAAANEEAAGSLLNAAGDFLREQNCTLAVGPMNGNTWRSYRFVDETGGRKPFLLEPRNPEAYAAWWRVAGFERLSSYTSSMMPLDGSEAVPPALRDRITRSGVQIRAMDPESYDEELSTIYELSLRSFANNFLYTPLKWESFLNSYRKVQQHVDPQFVRIAERDGVPCGFVFGIPDLEAAARGERPALIVKTLAVDPRARSAGLGSLLIDEVNRIARDKGYIEAIHALQHETNTSLKITCRYHSSVFRNYILFSKAL